MTDPSLSEIWLSGSFVVEFSLSSASPAVSDLSLAKGDIGLFDSNLLLDLDVQAEPPAPFHLEPGSRLEVTFRVGSSADEPGQRVPAQVAGLICDPDGSVVLRGYLSEQQSEAVSALGTSLASASESARSTAPAPAPPPPGAPFEFAPLKVQGCPPSRDAGPDGAPPDGDP